MATRELLNYLRWIEADHREFWDDLRRECTVLRACASSAFWGLPGTQQMVSPHWLLIECPVGAAHLDTLMGILFTAVPGVELGKDCTEPTVNVPALKEVSNRWLRQQREEFERSNKLGLTFQYGAIKITRTNTKVDLLDQFRMTAIPPWDVLLDRTAPSWERQRFCGTRTWVPYQDAKERWNKRDWNPREKLEYLDYARDNGTRGARGYNRPTDTTQMDNSVPKYALYVEVYEIYDLLRDRVYWWSPDCKEGHTLLGEEEIPLRDKEGGPLIPIVPLIFDSFAEKPLMGRAPLSRIVPAWSEKCNLRTHMANAVRRDNRIGLMSEEAFSEEGAAEITAGVDGTVVRVPSEDVSKAMAWMQMPPLSMDYGTYERRLDDDINRSGIADMAKGQATNATATEVQVMAEYTSTNISRLAKIKDDAMARCVEIYLAYIELFMSKPFVVAVGDEAEQLTREDFAARLFILPIDGASTPVTKALHRQQLLELTPVLTQLGSDPNKIREELVRAFGQSMELAKAMEPDPTAMQAQGGQAMGGIPGMGGGNATPMATPGPGTVPMGQP